MHFFARRFLAALLSALLISAPPSANGSDLADEADLHFELGTDRFRAHDYKAALEHFLASNRLVPNRNVVANIASTYAALKLYPEAFRYYTQALNAEPDAKEKAALQRALDRITPLVAVLKVHTIPEGATLFIDRKDLGPRGQTPAVLGFTEARVKALVELEGYESAESPSIELTAGASLPITIKLTRVVGTVKMTGNPYGALVTVEGLNDLGCALPCSLQLPPGRRTLQVRKEGYLPTFRRLEIPAKEQIETDFQLAPVTGGLIVNTDEHGAQVEVDGHTVGFTPAVLDVPVGEREVRVTLRGFQTVEQKINITAGEQAKLELALSPVEEISAASRTAEKLEDAPSSVTVISGNEIRAMGYPTLYAALQGERGILLSDDRSYQAVGVRGFGPPGSYSNRVLILQDGHSMNDDWAGQAYFGYDGRTDLGDIDRIEIVRGPGSVLYGTGAFDGVFNLVSRAQDDTREVSVTLATDETGLYRGRVAFRTPLGVQSGIAISASGLSGQGASYNFPELAALGETSLSNGADGVRGGNVSLQTWWRDFTLEASWNLRNKQAPTGEYATLVGNDGTRYVDTRAYAELRFTPRLGEHVELFSRVFLDAYHYDAQLEATPDNGGLRREYFWGEWAGAEARLTIKPVPGLRIMVGAEGQDHFRVYQTGSQHLDTPKPQSYLNQRSPYQVAAGYLLADWTPVDAIHISAGARLDAYSTFGSSLNPRLSFVFKPYGGGTTKLMLGKAFRAPSIYELYYNDGGVSQLPACNPTCTLKPETVYSAELEQTHHFSEEWSVIGAVYTSRSTDLIALRAAVSEPTVNQYANTNAPVVSLGAELEIRREWRNGIFLSANYALQKTSYAQDTNLAAADQLRQVPNSPNNTGGLRLSIPIVGRSLRFSTRITAESGRFNIDDTPGEPQQLRTTGEVLWDLMLSGELPDLHLRWNAGLYNATDFHWSAPVSPEFSALETVPQAGRAFVASLTFSY